mmetsp:Transcript_26602/g.57420  ORF Transcript_26602/g.57420 Transcript_26602/m.57420 type:complete len:255 (-) Transcript_26602:433-1197(-)
MWHGQLASPTGRSPHHGGGSEDEVALGDGDREGRDAHGKLSARRLAQRARDEGDLTLEGPARPAHRLVDEGALARRARNDLLRRDVGVSCAAALLVVAPSSLAEEWVHANHAVAVHVILLAARVCDDPMACTQLGGGEAALLGGEAVRLVVAEETDAYRVHNPPLLRREDGRGSDADAAGDCLADTISQAREERDAHGLRFSRHECLGDVDARGEAAAELGQPLDHLVARGAAPRRRRATIGCVRQRMQRCLRK